MILMLFLLLRRGCDCQPRGDLRLRDFPVGVGANFRQLVHQDHEGQNQREMRVEVGRGTGSILCQLDWEPTSASWYIRTMKVRTREKGEWKWGGGQVVFSASWRGSQLPPAGTSGP
jgi:hypothetical protein